MNNRLPFLDIQMPEMTGIDFFEVPEEPPTVVFARLILILQWKALSWMYWITFWSRSLERFNKTIAKAREEFGSKSEIRYEAKPAVNQEYMFVKAGQKSWKVKWWYMLYMKDLKIMSLSGRNRRAS